MFGIEQPLTPSITVYIKESLNLNLSYRISRHIHAPPSPPPHMTHMYQLF